MGSFCLAIASLRRKLIICALWYSIPSLVSNLRPELWSSITDWCWLINLVSVSSCRLIFSVTNCRIFCVFVGLLVGRRGDETIRNIGKYEVGNCHYITNYQSFSAYQSWVGRLTGWLGCFGINLRCAAFPSSAWIIVGSATIDSAAVAAMPAKKFHFVMITI